MSDIKYKISFSNKLLISYMRYLDTFVRRARKECPFLSISIFRLWYNWGRGFSCRGFSIQRILLTTPSEKRGKGSLPMLPKQEEEVYPLRSLYLATSAFFRALLSFHVHPTTFDIQYNKLSNFEVSFCNSLSPRCNEMRIIAPREKTFGWTER